MSNFELTGVIIEAFPAQTFNKGFRKREFVVETGDKYPQKILFQLVQEKCDMLESFGIGDTVTVSFNPKGRDWTDKTGQVKYFTTLEAWRISGQKRAEIGNSSDDTDFDDIHTSAPIAKSTTILDELTDDDLPF